MIGSNSLDSENFDHLCTSLIQEFTIMRYDEISAFPCVLEIFFEPFNTGEIDEVGWFVEEEEFWF